MSEGKRKIEEVYKDITEELDKILEKYGKDKVSDEFLMEVLELIRDTLEISYNRDDISIMVFNEGLIYDNVLYNTFYDLYKKLYSKVVFSNRFVKKMEILKKNINSSCELLIIISLIISSVAPLI